MARKLEVSIVGDASSLQKSFKSASKSADGFGSKITSAFGGVAKASAFLVGGAALGGLAVTLKTGAAEWMGHAQVAAQTAAVLKSTGGAANVSQKQVEGLAGALLQKTGIDDEAIQSGENLLLTFRNVRNEVGAGNDIFNQATKATLDMSVAMGTDMKSAAILVGKAINDPVKGLTALNRIGITFTAGQKKQIKALVESGHTIEAQKIILGEFQKELGGSAEAVGKTLPGQLNLLRESFNNLAGDLAGELMPGLRKGIDAAAGFVNKLASANGWHAKLNIVWDGIQEAGRTVTAKIGDAIRSVDWAAVWGKAQGIGEGLKARFEAIDWASVGATIGNGLAAGVGKADQIGKKIADSLAEAMRSIDWNQLGRSAGPGVAAAMLSAVATILDPAFWVKNWDLMLAVASVAFGGAIGRVAGKLGGIILGRLSPAFLDSFLTITARIETHLPTWMGDAVIKGLVGLPNLVRSLLAKLIAPVTDAFGRLGRIAQFVVKVLGVQAAINAIAGFAQDVYNKLKGIVAGAYSAALDIGRGIVAGIIGGVGDLASSLGSRLASGVRSAVDHVKGIFGIHSPSTVTMNEVGQPLADGVISGWLLGSAALPSKMSDGLRNAIEAGRQTIEASRSKFTDAFGSLSSVVDSAFSAIQATARTKSEKLLDKLVSKHDADEFKQNLADAKQAVVDSQKALDDYIATSGGTPDQLQKVADATTKVTLAQQAYNDAVAKGGDASAKAMSALVTLHSAQSALGKAQADVGVDPSDLAAKQQAVTSAQQQVDDLLYQQQTTALQKRADQERLNLDARNAVRKTHLDTALSQLATSLAKEGATSEDATKRVLKVLGSYGVNFKAVGQDMGSAWVQGLKEAIAAAASGAGKLSGTISNAAGSIKVPKRAAGGPVFAGQTYLVGEQGPELFTASSSGRIIPNGGSRGAGGAGGGTVFAPVFNLPNYLGTRDELVQTLGPEMVRYARRNGIALGGAA